MDTQLKPDVHDFRTRDALRDVRFLEFEAYLPPPVNIAQSLVENRLSHGLWVDCSKSCAHCLADLDRWRLQPLTIARSTWTCWASGSLGSAGAARPHTRPAIVTLLSL
jgi:hypothetical protein